MNTHAIGDRANRVVLDIYEKVFKANPDKTNFRWRIEHAQHLDPADVPRFAQLGVIAAMQGTHATSDGPWIPKRLGEERAIKTSYVFRDLLRPARSSATAPTCRSSRSIRSPASIGRVAA